MTGEDDAGSRRNRFADAPANVVAGRGLPELHNLDRHSDATTSINESTAHTPSNTPRRPAITCPPMVGNFLRVTAGGARVRFTAALTPLGVPQPHRIRPALTPTSAGDTE